MNNQKHLYNKLLVVDSSKRDKKIYLNSNSTLFIYRLNIEM